MASIIIVYLILRTILLRDFSHFFSCLCHMYYSVLFSNSAPPRLQVCSIKSVSCQSVVSGTGFRPPSATPSCHRTVSADNWRQSTYQRGEARSWRQERANIEFFELNWTSATADRQFPLNSIQPRVFCVHYPNARSNKRRPRCGTRSSGCRQTAAAAARC